MYKITADDIVNSIRQFGFTAGRGKYLDYANHQCCALGGLALRYLGYIKEDEATNLETKLSIALNENADYLHGIEAGWEGWSNPMGTQAYYDGVTIGQEARHRIDFPEAEKNTQTPVNRIQQYYEFAEPSRSHI
jgi:hypothetical protein